MPRPPNRAGSAGAERSPEPAPTSFSTATKALAKEESLIRFMGEI
jgi:hypothetical protein